MRSMFTYEHPLLSMLCCAIGVGLTANSRADSREAARIAVPATVAIQWQQAEKHTTNKAPDFYDAYGPFGPTSFSSGTVVSPDGLIVSFASETQEGDIKVTFSDGRSLPAKRLVLDRRIQLSLLKVEAGELPHIRLAQQSAELGETVLAAMSADADQRVVARGIIAATGCKVPGMQQDVIQTDIPLTQMSAGAPLVNDAGELVGVIVAASLDETNGLTPTYAVAVEKVRELLGVSARYDTEVVINSGFLGIAFDGGTDAKPVVKTVVADSPAAHVDIEPGDEIVSVNGKSVATTTQATELIAGQPAGELVVVELQRNAEPIKVQVRLGERPPSASVPDTPQFSVESVTPGRVYWYGADGQVSAADPQAVRKYWYYQPQSSESHGENGHEPRTTDQSNTAYAYWSLQSRNETEPKTPVLRVERTELDQKIEALTSEVQSLREQVQTLTEQLSELATELAAQKSSDR